jgi:hypothetical protein
MTNHHSWSYGTFVPRALPGAHGTGADRPGFSRAGPASLLANPFSPRFIKLENGDPYSLALFEICSFAPYIRLSP